MNDYSYYIEKEPKFIKDLVNEILNHPLVTGENEKWIMHKDSFRIEQDLQDGGTIDFYELEDSVPKIAHIIKTLLKYKPKKIFEVGMNVGAFALIAKLTLKDVKVFSVEKNYKYEIFC